MRKRTHNSAITHYGSAPDHTRLKAVDRVGDHTLEKNVKHARGRRGGVENLGKWQDGRLLRHLGGSCGLRARLLPTKVPRCLDGPKQQQSATHTYGPALGQQHRASRTASKLYKTEPSLGGITLMTHAKFEVIAKLIMCTRGKPFPSQDGPPERKCHLRPCSDRRVRAMSGFGRDRSRRKPGKLFDCRSAVHRKMVDCLKMVKTAKPQKIVLGSVAAAARRSRCSR